MPTLVGLLLSTPVLLSLPIYGGSGQIRPAGDSVVTVVPGASYAASGFHRFFWGDHYRAAWASEVEVDVLDLRRFAGGLTPIRRGGGRQTRSLRFKGQDGKEYSFRSVDKNPAAALPEYLRNSLATSILQDQISSQHPAGPMVSQRLIEAANVLSATPYLCIMPDDPALGEFREEFAGMVGTIEERPDENDEAVAAFAGAETVIGSERLYERVREHPDDRVHSRAFLTARLLDLYLGDWDRHADQWRWAQFGSDSAPGWRPIPRDRDQVFARLDGLFPSLAHMFTPELVSFGPNYPKVIGLHWTARALDRRFLTDLERPVWDSIATDLASRFTDQLIDDAVSNLPPELDSLDGDWLRRSLRQRRDSLPVVAAELYELIARKVDVFATDEDELVEIGQEEDGRVAVRISIEGADPYYERRFLTDETDELRLFLFRGDDRIVVRGADNLGLQVRVMGGRGDDELVYETPTRGVRLYDDRGTNSISGDAPGRTGINTTPYDTVKLREDGRRHTRDWGHSRLLAIGWGYSSDYGILLGAGPTFVDFGFRKDPHASKLTAMFAATTKGKFDLSLGSEIWFENSQSFATIQAFATQLDVLHYYGPGNKSNDIGDDAFYNVARVYVTVEPALNRVMGSHGLVTFGIPFRLSRTDENEGRFISTLPDLYGSGTFASIGAHTQLAWDSRPRENHLATGAAVFFNGWVFPRMWDVESTYGGVRIEAKGDWRLPLPIRTTLAARGGTQKVWGAHPWFDASFIGGSDILRGWRAQRFAGDLSLYGSAELRTHLADINVLIPQMFGFMLLADVGRVYVDGESPGGWHTGIGAGLWTGILGPKNVASASLVKSEQGYGLYFGWGFGF